jgi:hypothetical protein
MLVGGLLLLDYRSLDTAAATRGVDTAAGWAMTMRRLLSSLLYRGPPGRRRQPAGAPATPGRRAPLPRCRPAVGPFLLSEVTSGRYFPPSLAFSEAWPHLGFRERAVSVVVGRSPHRFRRPVPDGACSIGILKCHDTCPRERISGMKRATLPVRWIVLLGVVFVAGLVGGLLRTGGDGDEGGPSSQEALAPAPASTVGPEGHVPTPRDTVIPRTGPKKGVVPTCKPPAPPLTDAGSAVRQVFVYFHCNVPEEAPSRTVVPVTRLVKDSPAVLRASLTELLQGPTEAERNVGIFSAFSPGTSGLLRGVTIQDGVAKIDFSDDVSRIDNLGTTNVSGQVYRELNATVFQYDTIDGVVYSLNGSPEDWCEVLVAECGLIRRTGPLEGKVES